MQSALGKYAHAVTAGIVILILLAWAIIHLGEGFGLVPETYDSTQLDTFALAAFTYLLGNVAAINGIKPDIEAANARLDSIGAPTSSQAREINANNSGNGQ